MNLNIILVSGRYIYELNTRVDNEHYSLQSISSKITALNELLKAYPSAVNNVIPQLFDLIVAELKISRSLVGQLSKYEHELNLLNRKYSKLDDKLVANTSKLDDDTRYNSNSFADQLNTLNDAMFYCKVMILFVFSFNLLVIYFSYLPQLYILICQLRNI